MNSNYAVTCLLPAISPKGSDAMQELASISDYFWMLTAAAVAGAIGGIGFELMPTGSRGRMGAIETPHRLPDSPYFDLGIFANLLLGAITAVAVLYFFPPETRTIVQDATGASQIHMSYDLVKLVALSLIVGSAGPSFLSSIQGRLAGALNKQKEADVNTAQDGIDKLTEAYQTALEAHHDDAKRQVNGLLDPLPATLKETLNKAAIVMPENGNRNGTAVLEPDPAGDDVDKIVEGTASEIHSICDSTVAGLKQQLQAQAETAKKDIRQQMGSA
jgi:hypothetical protein